MYNQGRYNVLWSWVLSCLVCFKRIALFLLGEVFRLEYRGWINQSWPYIPNKKQYYGKSVYVLYLLINVIRILCNNLMYYYSSRIMSAEDIQALEQHTTWSNIASGLDNKRINAL